MVEGSIGASNFRQGAVFADESRAGDGSVFLQRVRRTRQAGGSCSFARICSLSTKRVATFRLRWLESRQLSALVSVSPPGNDG